MKASETSLVGLIQGQKQFQIPLYQRTYSWQDKHLGRLWDDIVNQIELLTAGAAGPSHFLGSVVLAPSPNTEAPFERWLVVDGQQRLTTLSVALAAVRDHLAADDREAAERINDQYLVNRWKKGDDHLRLLPTQADRPSYVECIRMNKASGKDRLAVAYQFFRNRLEALEAPISVEDVEQVLTTRLTLVVITADHGDNVHRIFESLNNTGLRLSQADLLRNYLFMCLPTRGDQVYEDYWLPLQRSLSNDQLEQLMWLQLVLDGDERVRRQDMYAAQQARLRREGETENAAEAYIEELARRSAHFIRMVDPAREADVEVRGYFQRLLQWRGGVAYPAVMLLLDRQERSELSSPDLLRALSYIESFLVRRAICQVPTNNLNRIFQALPSQLPAGRSVVDGLHWVLSGSRRFWPSDEELRKAIRWNPFYWQGRPEQQRMVLQRLEESYGHPEPVNFAAAALTVEHVLPQNPGGEWLKVLAEDAGEDESAQELHERLVHTLGNLTLTAENAKLSNHPFQRKQDLLSGSHLEMNRRIAEATRWGMSEILARADDLADRATALWPAPGEGSHKVERGRDWALLHQALLVMPAGTWTTYGDLATLVGSHPRPIGAHLANTPGVVNAYRVLGHGGRVSDTFRWAGEDRGDVLTVLRADGITFNEQGAADPGQRLTARDLADLLGMAEPGSTTTAVGADALVERQQRFLDQLHEHNSDAVAAAVVKLLKHWTTLGGVLQFGDGTTVTSCFLVLERPNQPDIWPLTIYPTYGRSGYLEVVFKYLANREPFDDLALRDELRARLNKLPGVNLPESKLVLRPSIPLKVLEDQNSIETLCETLRWFHRNAEIKQLALADD